MRAPLAAVLLLAASPAAGQAVERETFAVLGWNDACSVAVQQLGYPALGEAIQDEPVLTRIGAITIAPGEDSPRTAWSVDWEGAHTWHKAAVQKALQGLAASGYRRPGFPEDIRSPEEGARSAADAVILSTATFGLRAEFKRPGGAWRWDQVRYSPLGDCGLFIFSRREDDHPFYRYFLRRFYSSSARMRRAQAHAENSRLLFAASELEAALAEAAIAARMEPELPAVRYRHAALLCLSGQLNECVAELGEAVRLDRKLAQQARTDPDFEEVYKFPGFRSLLRKKP
jgi:hypothetical protein